MQSILIIWLLEWLAGCQESGLALADGSYTDFSDYQGRWVVLNYWAEWCAPCRAELPELNELNEHDSIVVLGVNFDGIIGEPLNKLITEMDIHFPVLLADPRARWQLEQPSVLPTTLVLDPNGDLAHQLTGPQTKAGLLELMALADPEPAEVTGDGTPAAGS